MDDGPCYALAPGHRLQWEPTQDRHVILYPEGMVKLNPSAAEILKRCDGETHIAELTADLEQAFGESDLSADVNEFLAVAVKKGWLVTR